MSLKDKAAKIDFASLPAHSPGGPEGVSTSLRPKTAPGLMMAHAADQRSELVRENETLRGQVGQLQEASARVGELTEELRQWDGAKAARLLDPNKVGWSSWANRDPANFTGQDFLDLKSEIGSSGGNVQPIKVRPAKPGQMVEYELVFGHRRHRACLELGLPVLAVVDNLGEVELFVQMDRENRGRKNLSAWEQGMMYRRALDQGLFPSNRKLSEQVGVDLAQVGKALALARLPSEVVQAFASPLDLQFRWAKLLAEAAEADPQGLKMRSSAAQGLGPNRAAKDVLAMLLAAAAAAEEGGRTVLPPPVEITRLGKSAAKIEFDARGRATVAFASNVVAPSQLKALQKLIEAFLDSENKLNKPAKT